jgi:hypothetical protein
MGESPRKKGVTSELGFHLYIYPDLLVRPKWAAPTFTGFDRD